MKLFSLLHTVRDMPVTHSFFSIYSEDHYCWFHLEIWYISLLAGYEIFKETVVCMLRTAHLAHLHFITLNSMATWGTVRGVTCPSVRLSVCLLISLRRYPHGLVWKDRNTSPTTTSNLSPRKTDIWDVCKRRQASESGFIKSVIWGVLRPHFLNCYLTIMWQGSLRKVNTITSSATLVIFRTLRVAIDRSCENISCVEQSFITLSPEFYSSFVISFITRCYQQCWHFGSCCQQLAVNLFMSVGWDCLLTAASNRPIVYPQVIYEHVELWWNNVEEEFG